MIGSSELKSLANDYLSKKEPFTSLLKDAKSTKTKEEVHEIRREWMHSTAEGQAYKPAKDAFKKAVLLNLSEGQSKETLKNALENESNSVDKKINKWFDKFQKYSQN